MLSMMDEELGGDVKTAEFVAAQLAKEQRNLSSLSESIGLMSLGITLSVILIFFPETVQLPLGYQPGDLEDLPPSGKRRGPTVISTIFEEMSMERSHSCVPRLDCFCGC